MRWSPTVRGVVILTAAVLFAFAARRNLFLPVDVQVASREVRSGMTLPEVEAIMGGPGESQLVFITGDIRYWRKNEYFKHRWEDAYATVDVSFQGPRGSPLVVHIERKRKDPPATDPVVGYRAALILLILGGSCLVLRGVFRANPINPAVSKPTSTPAGTVREP